jgi:hypothetical protein
MLEEVDLQAPPAEKEEPSSTIDLAVKRRFRHIIEKAVKQGLRCRVVAEVSLAITSIRLQADQKVVDQRGA